MKKLCWVLLMWVFFSTNCFAMNFFQPVKIGRVTLPPMGYFMIDECDYHKGTPCKDENYKNVNGMYEKGVVRFGNGENALFFHYDVNKKVKIPDSNYYGAMSRFGSQDVKNAVQVWPGIPTIIKQIKTDSGMVFYLLSHGDAAGFGVNQTLIGKRTDGIFVKYFDTRDIKKKYLGGSLRGISDEWDKIFLDKNTIIIRYGKYGQYNAFVPAGEFRFKWDEAAQWFGVEHVVY